jgi:rSAM/selenodomain-associated transferase 2/rSAM/selenodomain-associated transferase 1
MYREMSVAVVIPALNEEQSIGKVIEAIPNFVDDIVVADNGSTDRTAEFATAAGARVVHEPRQGYGQACLTALQAVAEQGGKDVVLFMDADFADDPTQTPDLLDKIVDEGADLVIGSRLLGHCERGALTLPQVFGNKLSCWLIRHFWGVRMTDLGPFRAVTREALARLEMDDRDFGWTVQMQTRAAGRGLRYTEVPVDYRRRIGVSKISGTVRGVYMAGTKILKTIFDEAHEQIRQQNIIRPAEALNIFSRYPEPGQTKTRLMPALGAVGAAELQAAMTRHTLSAARTLQNARPELATRVYYAGGDAGKMAARFGDDWDYQPQAAGDLGARMAAAFADRFADGARRVGAIGIDCPGVTDETLHHAFDALKLHDLVLGPASDGGYYLIGLSRPADDLFDGVDWGTGAVLQQTLDIAQQLGLSVALLDELHDVDEPTDLPVWEAARQLAAKTEHGPTISVIIPTLNETQRLWRTLGRVVDLPGVEVIVADGGSTDGTVQMALEWGVGVVHSAPGRAAQMNAGATEAAGHILLFLHADTLLPENWPALVRTAMADTDPNRFTVAGAFELGIKARGWRMRCIERLVNLRSRWLGMPYGDQAIFIRRATFERMGGYASMPIMEDYELMRRANRLGHIAIAPAPVRTSVRYWRRRGVLKTTAINLRIVLGYWIGVAPDKLSQWRNHKS